MTDSRVLLRGGGEAVICCKHPPLAADDAGRIAEFVERFLVEEYLHDSLVGRFSEEACFTVGLGLAADSLLASCWSGYGRDFPNIAVVGGVATDETHRGQGLALAVVGAICERFDSDGGRLLCLGTSNPAARRIYERLGFRQVAGHVFCRAARGARLDEGFAAGRRVTARAASWREMASIVPLYLLEHPCVLADAATRMPSARVAEPRRCVRIFQDLWKSIETGGKWSVLRNDLGWPVASALARRAPDAPNAFSVDFLWHPDYSVEAAGFVADWLDEIEAASDGACSMLICDGDEWKIHQARMLGFERTEGGGNVDLNGRKVPLMKFVRAG